ISDSDYTIIKVNRDSNEQSLDDYGQLTFAEALPEKDDPVSIIQHPKGEYKQVAMSDNLVTEISTKSIEYRTDTLPGSSGSPVLNYDWQVVGLHRGSPRGKDANIATRIDFILGELQLNYSS
ncbi:MAG: serine protease, partial [Bacteroidota bacterium]